MKISYQVTFETDSSPPKTATGTVVAGGPATAANRAVKDAKKQLKGARWSSLVVVLERVDAEKV